MNSIDKGQQKMIGEHFKYRKLNNNFKTQNRTIKICVEGNSDPMKEIINRIPKKKDIKEIKIICNSMTKDKSYYKLTQSTQDNEVLLTSPQIKDINYKKLNYENYYSIYRRNHKLDRINNILVTESNDEANIIFDNSKIDKINLLKSYDKTRNLAFDDFKIVNNNIPYELKSIVKNRSTIYNNIPKIKEIKLLRNRLTIIDKCNNRQSLPILHNTRRDSCHKTETQNIIRSLKNFEIERNKILNNIICHDIKNTKQ